MITKQLNEKYTLFDSLEEMLAPETLNELLFALIKLTRKHMDKPV